MEQGILTRFEEITRTPAEVQDCLISVLSDKVMNVPELGDGGILFARPGFNVIATANTRDKGVNEMSSALKRRFSFETVQPVGDVALEKQIILDEAGAMARSAGISAPLDEDAAALLATAYHELRQGVSAEGDPAEKACRRDEHRRGRLRLLPDPDERLVLRRAGAGPTPGRAGAG